MNIRKIGSVKVTLSLTAEPNIASNPTDIVLILDRSRSMAGSPLANLKSEAKKFIDIIDGATDGAQDGHIGYGSRIGIVSFADTARQDTQFITDVDDLKDAVDDLSAGGLTNHADAFTKALQLFDPASTNEKVMIMFTDGRTTAGANPNPVAEAAKAQGVIIYCIGLSGNGGLDEQALRDWASDPDSAYVAITPNDEELEDLFENLAQNIAKPGATDIVIEEEVNPCFEITELSSPTKGTVERTGQTSLRWMIDELGVTSSEGAELEFTLQYIGPCSGVLEINKGLKYRDNEGNSTDFQSPEITVDCGTVVFPEECPKPVPIDVCGCKDTVEFDAGEIGMESLGRIVKLDVTLRDVCPNKRVALGVILTELGADGVEHKRGMKTVTVPAHRYQGCRDVTVKCIKFVLPENPEDPWKTEDSICKARHIKARFIAHYVDNDFECCDITLQ